MKKRRHPDWLKVHLGGGSNYLEMKKILRKGKLHTICEEAKCPNMPECFSRGTAVFLILGDTCTRNCKYCNVKHGNPNPLNKDEALTVAESVKKLGLKYVVITSVTRDDLKDGGASVFYDCVKEIKKKQSKCKVEVLIPDFKGCKDSLKKVIDSNPDVINHNIEVSEELFHKIRPEGSYKISLSLLKNIKNIDDNIKTKSGFMVGLGEGKNNVIKTMKDLKKVKVDFLTIGQYLQPTINHTKIKKYYTPDEFIEFKKIALDIGFKHVESGPLVRSSYHAERAIFETKKMKLINK
jgi:lipoic acid synthetase